MWHRGIFVEGPHLLQNVCTLRTFIWQQWHDNGMFFKGITIYILKGGPFSFLCIQEMIQLRAGTRSLL